MLTVVKPRIDADTIETLSKLLKDAQAGKVIGLAYVALHTHHRYSGDLVGTATDSPLLARGICRALEDAISQK